MHVYTRTCITKYIHAYMPTYVHTQVHAYVQACPRSVTNADRQAYQHTYQKTYVHAHVHTDIHTYIHATHTHTRCTCMSLSPFVRACVCIFLGACRKSVLSFHASRLKPPGRCWELAFRRWWHSWCSDLRKHEEEDHLGIV